jgi:hypothetical protein
VSTSHNTIIPPELEAFLAQATPEWHPDIADLFRKWQTDPRTALTRHDCQIEGGWGQTTQIEKEKSGALRSLRDGKKRLITTSSFYTHLIERVIASHPVSGPKRRQPTPAELDGLRRANEQRHREALERKGGTAARAP